MLANFLTRQWDGHSALLLGYSGGPDSKALLYALLEAGCRTLHLAHVDHGWRPESANEEQNLRLEALRLHLPFHSIRLTPPIGGNKEAAARSERLAFFHSLAKQFSFQALLLAHHADDVAETVLKRVLEGAHLPFLGGMEPVSHFQDLPVWRPLLFVKRKQILAFLQERDLHPLADPTNGDPAYLRARMRSDIFPALSFSFGKEISDNLSLLSRRSFEFRDYLDKKLKDRIPSCGPWGVCWPLADLERIEARHLLQTKARRMGISWPRTFLESILDAALSKRPNCRFSASVFVDRGDLFFLAMDAPRCGAVPLDLVPGVHHWGDWVVAISETAELVPEPGWRSVWTGKFSISARNGFLAMPPPGNALRQLWNEWEVPAFMRRQVPVLWREGAVVKEFLSGKNGKALPENGPLFKLSFEYLTS